MLLIYFVVKPQTDYLITNDIVCSKYKRKSKYNKQLFHLFWWQLQMIEMVAYTDCFVTQSKGWTSKRYKCTFVCQPPSFSSNHYGVSYPTFPFIGESSKKLPYKLEMQKENCIKPHFNFTRGFSMHKKFLLPLQHVCNADPRSIAFKGGLGARLITTA